MAKGSFLGVKRGKLGDAVGYNVANSSDGIKQGWRIYQPVVSNPQTDGQIDQRIKLTAVNNLYRALKPIIQRGWENHKYGDESRRAFLKRALGSEYFGPYLPKGSTLAVPIEGVPITYGSLTPVTVEGGSSSLVLTNVQNSSSDALSLGLLSQCFIDAVGAKAGDQVTIIIGYLNLAGTVTYTIGSFYLDPTSTDEELGTLTGFDWLTVTYNGELCLAVDTSSFSPAYCGLVAMSRDGDGANLRSYADFFMSTEFRTYFYGTASQVEAAKASYRKKVTSSTNWPLVPGGEVQPTGTTRAMTNGATAAQIQVTAYRIQGDYIQVYDNTNAVWRYVYCTDVRLSQYHGWLTSDMVSAGMWSTTAPSGADAANAVRMVSGTDATAVDLEFDAWLVDVGYNPRFIYGNIPS